MLDFGYDLNKLISGMENQQNVSQRESLQADETRKCILQIKLEFLRKRKNC